MEHEHKTSLKWDRRFMRLALEARSWVKGPDLGVGACVVDPFGRLLSLGYSGYPRGFGDTETLLTSKTCKDKFMVHAEANAILNAGRSVAGWTLYSTKAPCTHCCALMMQAAIARIVSPEPEESSSWYPNQVEGLMVAQNAGIRWTPWNEQDPGE